MNSIVTELKHKQQLDTASVLQITDISHGYGEKNARIEVLKNISFTLKRGTLTALVGPSGSGKSTLLHICGLLETPEKGHITVDGIDCTKASDKERTGIRRDRIGFVYQSHRLLPEFSAIENVMLPLQLASEDSRKRAESLLNRFGLSHRCNHRPAELSGGEQQRVSICRALANKPSLILADEPTGNLDPKTSDIVFKEFLSLARDEGVTALIATHNIGLANQMDSKIEF
jgi:lipoprotein-releasing system ATP-binding protein